MSQSTLSFLLLVPPKKPTNHYVQLEAIIEQYVEKRMFYKLRKVNVCGMNVWCWIKALFAAGQVFHTTNFWTKPQVFNKTATQKNNPQIYLNQK